MSKVKLATLAVVLCIVGIAGIIPTFAKSYSFIINSGSGMYVHFTKYQCETSTHSALNATKLEKPKNGRISITTTLHSGSNVNGKQIGSHNHVYSNSSMTDEWNWSGISTPREATIKSTNITEGSTLHGRLYINNGFVG